MTGRSPAGAMPNGQPAGAGVSLTWLGQSGFVISDGATAVAIDPFLTPDPRRAVEPVADADTLAGVNVVLCTHEHPDHMDLPTLKDLARISPVTRYVVPSPVVEHLVMAGVPPEG